MALTASRQLRPSPTAVHTPAYPPPPPLSPRCYQHGPRQASTIPTPPPALSPAQSQRLKTILTNFFYSSSHRLPPSTLSRLSQVPLSHSFKHRADTVLLAHHIFNPHSRQSYL